MRIFFRFLLQHKYSAPFEPDRNQSKYERMKELPFCYELCYTNPITNNGSPYFARFDLGKLLSENFGRSSLESCRTILEGKGFFVFI